MSLVPFVIERSGREERAMDIYSRLLRDRIIILGSEIYEDVTNSVVAQLLYLQSEDPDRDVHLYINSYGGDTNRGMAIYDTMQFISCDVATYCVGCAMSMASILLAGGTPGKRHALPHARIMIHQISSAAEGQAEDILIRTEDATKWYEQLCQVYVKCTGQPLDRIKKDLERDRYMSPEEALEYGLIDRVIEHIELKGEKGEKGGQ